MRSYAMPHQSCRHGAVPGDARRVAGRTLSCYGLNLGPNAGRRIMTNSFTDVMKSVPRRFKYIRIQNWECTRNVI
jgi:hypothetical protein